MSTFGTQKSGLQFVGVNPPHENTANLKKKIWGKISSPTLSASSKLESQVLVALDRDVLLHRKG